MRKETSIPFVGLHAHSVAGSPFDGFGYPSEHMDFAYENGMDALALTDHGNMVGTSYQILHAKKMQKEGKDFKPIFGVEAYFIPSVKDWKESYLEAQKDKKKAKASKKGDSSLSVEDEEATKRAQKNILNRRRHLILIAQNQTGLNNIYKIVSTSFKGDYFYRFPRIDYDLLRENNEGIIAASACAGGIYAGCLWENKEKGSEAVLGAMRKVTENMLDIFGDRWYGELQWNAIKEQHELNQYIIQMHHEYGIPLISTADSHYPRRDSWKDRELYKRLGFLNSKKQSKELPKSVDQIGYELYPKNGDEMWESYKKYSKQCGFEYDDQIVLDSITRTHDIAFNRIESFIPDSTVRLPGFVVPEGMSPAEALTKLAIEGLKAKGLVQTEYIERLKHELNVINGRGFSKYFLTMKAIADKANQNMLSGPGRGSAAGALTSYVLDITQIDPIKYGLMFSRFMRADAKDYPDIDFDVSRRMELVDILIDEWGENTVVPISNFNTLQPASLIKDISKFYDIPFTEVNKVTSKMEKEATPAAKKKLGMKAGAYKPNYQDLLEFSESLQKFLKKHPYVGDHIANLVGQTRATGRHAGGVVIGEELDKYMPLIASKGVTQTPWSEGQNVRHLEPLGFIKFDILGISSLEMIENCIERVLKQEHGINKPIHKDIKKFYDEKLHPDVLDLEDQKVYEDIFHKGNFLGTFQFTNEGAQKFCMQVKPRNIIDISAVTSIYRPGPLSAGVDKKYVKARNNPHKIEYVHPLVKEATESTSGFLIFQEQIALLAHKLGKDISLDEGNKLRKLLTKKGTGKGAEEKEKIRQKFIEGCVEKNISNRQAEKLWETFEYFSGYGFNASHAVSYSILSFQCAWLYHYYPACWAASFLDKEPESRKEAAINLVQNYGFKIKPANINISTGQWEQEGNTLIQPLSSIKGMGDKAIEQVLAARPFRIVEELLFNPNIKYSKLNKRALDVLCRAGALDSLVDTERFTGRKHFWSACIVDRPKTPKKLKENIQKYAPEGDFTKEEIIEYRSSLSGLFPFELVLDDNLTGKLERMKIPSISDLGGKEGICWFIPREIVEKKTARGKDYLILKVIDPTAKVNTIKCWGYRPGKDSVFENRPYMAKLDYSESWGYSLREIPKRLKLLG